jgi:hypothetical protein
MVIGGPREAIFLTKDDKSNMVAEIQIRAKEKAAIVW